MKYRPDIDGLRFFAVVPVVLYHAKTSLVPGGYIGVDIFFVISGYLITGILLNDIAASKFSLLTFYERRARRIMPSLLLVLAATLVCAYFILGPGDYARLGRSALATIAFSSNIWFWFKQGDYFAASSETQALLHTWSLAVEEQFYLFYPIILALILRFRWRPLPLIALLSLASLAVSIWGVIYNPLAAFYLIPPRAWELGIGCLVAILVHEGALTTASNRTATIIGALGFAGIALPMVFYTSFTAFPGIAALPPCIGAALLIAAGGLNGRNPVTLFIGWKPFRLVGLISYALYLWHWPIMAFARVATGNNNLTPLVATATVLLSFLLAWASTVTVERVFRNRQRTSAARIFTVSGAGMAATAAMALAIVAFAGLPSRLSPRELQILDVTRFDPNELPNRCDWLGPLSAKGCRLGNDDGRAPEFMLWGDSHAGAISPAVEKAAIKEGHHGRLAWLIGCPPALGIYTSVPSNQAYCPRFNNSALQYLKEHPTIKTVYLQARWALYATGVYPERDDASIRLFEVDSSKPGADNSEILSDGVQRTVAAIRALGKEVVFIEGIPEFNWDVPSALYAHERFGSPIQDPLSRKVAEDRNRIVMDMLTRIAAANQSRIISMTDEVCADSCLVEYKGYPVYRDANHFSPQAADSLVYDVLEREQLFASAMRSQARSQAEAP